jgi:Na+/melibiose symporter-like transporter
VIRLVSPGIGGVLVQWMSAPGAILINAAAFAISFLNLRRMTIDEPEPKGSGKHPLHDIREGFAFIAEQPALRIMAWCAASWHVLFYGYAALLALFILRDLGLSPGQMGLAEMFNGLGVLASSFILRKMNKRFGQAVPIILGAILTALAYVVTALIPNRLFGSDYGTIAALAFAAFVTACGLMLFFIPYTAMRQKLTPDALLGRVINTMRFLTVAIAPLGALTAGYLANQIGTRATLGCIAAGGIALAITMARSRTLRSVRP